MAPLPSLRLLPLLALPLIGAPLAGDAPPLAIPGVSTALVGQEVRVTASLARPLPPELVSRLASGLPTTTVWRIGLFVFRNLWWDGEKDERTYAVTVTFRPVSGDFVVERRLDEKLIESQVLPTRHEAEEALAGVNALPCFTMGKHLLGKRLVVKVRCAIGTGLSLGVVPTTLETGWRRSGVFDWNGAGR